jgi:DNA-binding NarL/FixJ family response regulator
MSAPRVVIVDDHQLVRVGVRAALAQAAQVVGEAGTVEEALAVIRRERPDVVLLDVHMPDGGGRQVIGTLAPELPDTRFLALSVSDAPHDVIAIIRAGARGYITKAIPAERLADAVCRVAQGDAVLSPRLAGFVLDAFREHTPAHRDPEFERLTPREREILHLIARAYQYKEIAHELGISTKTVETHVSSVLRKLQLSNRHQLTRWATDRHLA